MKKLGNIYRIWVVLTAGFMLLTGAIGGLAIFYRAKGLNDENQKAMLSMLSLHFEKDYSKLAEEVYLQLGSLKLREEYYQQMLGGRGSVTVELIQKQSGVQEPRKGPQSIAWLAGADSENTLSFPLYFADKYLGHVQAKIIWHKHQILGQDTASVLGTTGVFLAALVAGWSLLVVFIKRRVLVPLISKNVQAKRGEAIVQTAQMLAHDLKEPFKLLRVATDALGQASTPAIFDQTLSSYIGSIRHAEERVVGMLNELMDINSKVVLKKEIIPVRTMVEEALSQLSSGRDASAVAITNNIPDGLHVEVDKVKMERVLINILANACEAMKDGGAIVISAKSSKSRVELSIFNDGPGISSELQNEIFDPFITSDKPAGTGLGLAIAKKYVLVHGGRIVCQSETRKGVTFVISLPGLRPMQRAGYEAPLRKKYRATLQATMSKRVTQPAYLDTRS